MKISSKPDLHQINVILDINQSISMTAMTSTDPVIDSFGTDLPSRIPESRKQAALKINVSLDRAFALHRVNEPCLETALDELDAELEPQGPMFWLLLARIFEAGIVCVGHYVDHAEYCLAGDLMMNPREIRVHFSDGTCMVKDRHSRLSDFFNDENLEKQAFMQRFQRQACLRTIKKPLLPLISEWLCSVSIFSSEYLESVQDRMEQVGRTMNFLWAWGLDGAEDVFRFQQTATRKQWRLVEQNRCHFTVELFHALGRQVDSLCRGPALFCPVHQSHVEAIEA